ncbi:putative G- coupled receptor [Schistosoma japonicum]|uniref:Putative G-coupled receptor n=1 Tax=Schistosoma japonicum TaxID=6182 RepID=A0A4Z2DT30_SCHJA|nr:putative G- coupled receptor [Schistosoma japonicum]
MEFNCTPDIGKMIIKVYASLLLMFGIPGNIISAIIMGGDKSNRLTTRLIIIILAIADNLVLLTAVLRYWLMEVYGWDLRTTGPLSCKIHVFAVGFSTDFAVGVLCAVAVERLLVVAIPYKASNLVTLRSVVIGMTCFALSVTIKNSLHFWMMGGHKSQQSQMNSINVYKSNHNTTNVISNADKLLTQNITVKELFKCTFVSEYEFMFRIFMKFDLISFAVLPYLILFTSNVIIYMKLRKQRRLMRCHANTVATTGNTTNATTLPSNTHINKAQRKLDRMSLNQPEVTNQLQTKDLRCKRSNRRPEGVIKLLTALTIIHVICTLPGTIFTFLSSYFNYFHDMPKYTHDQIKFGLVMLIFTNNAINFFGYCISCTTFRQTIFHILVIESE